MTMLYLSRLLVGVVAVVLAVILIVVNASSTVNTEWPMPTTVVIGSVGQFTCSGLGLLIHWEVDGLPSTDAEITKRGITSHVVSTSSGTVYLFTYVFYGLSPWSSRVPCRKASPMK